MSRRSERERRAGEREIREQAAPPDAAGGQGSFTRPDDVTEVPPEREEPRDETGERAAPPLHRDAPPRHRRG